MVRDLKFIHLTTNDGLSQGYVVAILQDRRGFMWFATRDGLNRYDGNAFVVYKNDPKDSGSLSSNFLQDLMQDDHGHLWIATNIGVNKFDPETERCTRYLHDPPNPYSLGGASVKSIAQGSLGSLWFGTEDSGLDKLDLTAGTFTHYRNDSDGHFVGRISQVIEDRHREINTALMLLLKKRFSEFPIDQLYEDRVTRHKWKPCDPRGDPDSFSLPACGRPSWELWLRCSKPGRS